MFSRTTIASSMSSPMASESAISVSMFSVMPRKYMTMNDEMTEIGSVRPVMIVECKSPEIPVNDKVFDQIVCYNMGFRVPYLVVTNGLDHYACRIDVENSKYEFLLVIPLYEDLQN